MVWEIYSLRKMCYQHIWTFGDIKWLLLLLFLRLGLFLRLKLPFFKIFQQRAETLVESQSEDKHNSPKSHRQLPWGWQNNYQSIRIMRLTLALCKGLCRAGHWDQNMFIASFSKQKSVSLQQLADFSGVPTATTVVHNFVQKTSYI